jgi:hypothetical protein
MPFRPVVPVGHDHGVAVQVVQDGVLESGGHALGDVRVRKMKAAHGATAWSSRIASCTMRIAVTTSASGIESSPLLHRMCRKMSSASQV